MDRFEEMRVFAAVVDAGSFVGASGALEMSKAAVSRYVAELESRLGVRLLHRTTRKLSLTPEGEVFHARCRELLGGVDEAEAEITSRSGEASGLLRINVPFSFGLLHLAPLWVEFMALHPKVTLDVTLADRVVDLVEEGFDMAVRIARLPNSSLVSRPLTSTRMVLCASPAYLHARGQPTHPSELASHDVLAYSLFSMGDQWEFTGSEGARLGQGDAAHAHQQRRHLPRGRAARPGHRAAAQLPGRTGPAGRHAGGSDAVMALDRAGRLRGLPLAQVRLAQGPADDRVPGQRLQDARLAGVKGR